MKPQPVSLPKDSEARLGSEATQTCTFLFTVCTNRISVRICLSSQSVGEGDILDCVVGALGEASLKECSPPVSAQAYHWITKVNPNTRRPTIDRCATRVFFQT